ALVSPTYPRGADRVADGRERGGGAGDLPGALGVVQVLGAGLQGDLEQPLLVRRGLLLDLDRALPREHPGGAAVLAEVPAAVGERVSDVLGRAVAVVGQRLDEHGDAARAVTLVRDLLVPSSVAEVAAPPLDRALDVLDRHREAPALVDRRGEGHVRLDVPASALACGDLHRAEQFRELVDTLVVVGY